MRSGQYWGWAFSGKHPIAGDFIYIGQDVPMVKSFSEWVDKGYHLLALQRNLRNTPVSWRFWAKGAQQGALVCGLIKDSYDSLGRSYPLLVMGSGPLKDWEDRWELLPLACEKSWIEIEYVSSRKVENLENLKTSIRAINPPRPQWSEFENMKKSDRRIGEESDFHIRSAENGNPDRFQSSLPDKKEIIVDLDREKLRDHFAAVDYLHERIKLHNKNAPQAMFAGGTVDRSFLAMFMRPLSTSDFVRLWTMTEQGVAEQA
jgi:type VI secretion system protein VasJ